MSDRSPQPLRSASSLLLGGVALLLGSSHAHADLVRLVNGGEVRGVVERSDTIPTTSTVRTTVPTGDVVVETLSGLVVTLDRRDVEFITFRRRVVEEYESLARHTPREVEAQRELADWCHDNGLVDERNQHLEVLVELAPDDVEARTTLRHVKYNDEWMTREESMARQGYVRHRNRWVTQQELALIEKTEAERDTERQWASTIRRLVIAMRSPRRQQEVLAELAAIDDPLAVPALVRTFADHTDRSVRMIYVDVLANIPGPAPVEPLVQRSLRDADPQVRFAAMNHIEGTRGPIAVPMFANALKSDDNQVVRRAASAIARFGGEEVVPQLADALVTRHEYRVAQRTTSGSMGFNTDGSGMVNPGKLSVSPEMAAMIQQGAVVLPSQNPVGKVRWVRVKYDHRNAEVHDALVKLTGRDFGYDERTWRLWWGSRKANGS